MAIVIHKKSRAPYLYLGENKFRNVASGKEGEVSDELAREVFTIHPALTELITEFPLIEKLIKVLELKIEK